VFYRSRSTSVDRVNPLDLTWHFYEEFPAPAFGWDQIRRPFWMVKFLYDLGDVWRLSQSYLEWYWNPGDWRPAKQAFLPRPWGLRFLDPLRNPIDGAFIGSDRGDYATRAPGNSETMTVRCMSLDEAYLDPAIPNPDFIKLDIEGAEQFALKHADRISSELSPVIMLELHNPECDRAAWEFARATGYRLFSLETNDWFERAEDVHGTVLCTRNGLA